MGGIMQRTVIKITCTVLVIIATLLVGCAAPSSSPSSTPTTTLDGKTQTTTNVISNTGRVEVRVTDAPPKEEVTSVMVTVESVEIHQAGANQEDETGWLTMKMSGANTFDLLQIKGLEEVLATGDLAVGNYTQIRMLVSGVRVTFKDGKAEDATVPSGKLKFVQPFKVEAGKSTVLLFDFDAAESVNVTGNSKVMFKPVIKLTVTKTPGTLEISPTSLPDGKVGVAYNATVTAVGGQAPYTWSVNSGNLPAGLNINAATGVISGMPTTERKYTFTIKATDNASTPDIDTQKLTINIDG
jgi:hypothetical protein